MTFELAPPVREMRMNRAERWSPVVVACLVAAPILISHGVPGTDLPLHEGMVSLLVHRGDPAFTRDLYVSNWGHANQLFYVLALPFAFVAGAAFACRILLAASIAATILASARLCDHVGASRWFALLSAPAALGWTFFHGFAPNVLGFALLLFALPYLDDFARAPSPRGALLSVGILVVLHLAHETSAACACAAVVVLALGGWRRPRDLALLALPELAGVVLYLLEARLERSVVTPFAHHFLEAGIQMHPPLKKLAYAAHCLLGPFAVEEEALVAGLVTIALVAGLARKREAPEAPQESWFARNRFALLAALFFVCFLTLPASINFGGFLYVRFLAPAYVIGVIAIGRGRRSSGVLAAVCCAVPLAWLMVALPEFARATEERRSVDELLPQIAEGSAVAVLELSDPGPPPPSEPAAQGNYVLAVRGGRNLHSLAEYPIAPLVVREGLRWDEATLRVYGAPWRLVPAWDLTHFRYVLLRISEAPRVEVFTRALAPDARLIGSAGAWCLFESTHPVVSVNAPDAGPPPPGAESLFARVNAVFRSAR